MNVRLNFYTNDKMNEKLEKEKKETGLNKTNILTIALLEYFEKRGK